MNVKVFIYCILFFPTTILAHFDINWKQFISNTDLIVKGMIVEKRVVFDDEGYFSSYEGTIDIVDVIDFKNKYPYFTKKKIDIGDLEYSNELGTVGYFFIHHEKGKWVLAERSVAIWLIEKPTSSKVRNMKMETKKLKVFYRFLHYIPNELYVDNINEQGNKVLIFYEEKLINYFRN